MGGHLGACPGDRGASGVRRDPVAALLRLRAIREKQARRDLAAAQLAEQGARAELGCRSEEYRGRPVAAGTVGAGELTLARLQGLACLEALDAARARVHQRAVEREAARNVWLNRSTDLDSAERLAGRREAQAALETARAEQAAADELVLTLRRRKQCS